MTLRDLTDEVSAMGFDGAIATDELFIASLNRALRQIFGEHTVTGRVTLSAIRSKPATRIQSLRHTMGESLSLPLRGKAYSFFTSGTGEFTLRDGKNTTHKSFDGTRVRFYGFLSGDGEITFKGELAYLVTDMVTFDEICVTRAEDIPDGRSVRRISIREMTGDFLSFLHPPTDANGNVIPDVRMEDGAIYIKDSFDGEINVTYRRLPKKIVSDEAEAEIDIPDEYAVLLGPLVASYVYLDSAPEKAELYGKLYRDMSDKELAQRRDGRAVKYVTNGWA